MPLNNELNDNRLKINQEHFFSSGNVKLKLKLQLFLRDVIFPVFTGILVFLEKKAFTFAIVEIHVYDVKVKG